jgi:hypothetical protein
MLPPQDAPAPAPAPAYVSQGAANPMATAPIAAVPVYEASDLSTRPLVSASLLFKESSKEIILPYKPMVHIGRSDIQSGNIPDVDLAEVDRQRVVSRKHSSIAYANGIYKISDAGSMNGTYVNSKKLEAGEEIQLKNGDEIMFGKLACIFNSTN